MSTTEPLAEFLHEKLVDLDAFASRIKQFITDHISADSRYGPFYVVKSRVKSYSSLEKNLLKLASENTPLGHNAQKMLIDEDRSLPLLMRVIDDLVGVRVVFHFRADVERLFRDMKDEKLRWFNPKRNHDRTIRAKRFNYDDESHSGYTSLHVSGGISKEYFIREDFVDMTAEIQIRTILEEAWGETNHYLVYKTAVYSKDDANDSMKTMKAILHQLDRELEKLHSSFSTRSKQYYSPDNLQNVGTYRIHRPKDTPERFQELHAKACDHRQRGEQQVALDIFHELKAQGLKTIGSKTIDTATGRLLRDEWEDRLKCDIAHQHLLAHTNTAQRIAEGLYKEVISRNDKHFWANFRLAYVYQKEDLDTAIGLAEKAVELVEYWYTKVPDKSECPIPWWRGHGLLPDSRAYLSSLYWRKAETFFRSTKAVIPGSWPEGASAEGSSYGRRALQVATDAHREAQAIPKDTKYSNLRRIHLRTLNAICFYKSQLGITEELSQQMSLLKELAASDPHPLVLDTLGWHDFKQGNIESAIDLLARAKLIGDCQVLPSGIRRSRAGKSGISLHYDIIEKCVSSSNPYRPGEEYWDWPG